MNVLELLQKHQSIRKFKEEPVSAELVRDIIISAQHASTSEFIQTYTVINITDRSITEAIYNEVTAQKTILVAPVFLIFLSLIHI